MLEKLEFENAKLKITLLSKQFYLNRNSPGCSPVNLLHNYRAPLSKNISGGLLLNWLECSNIWNLVYIIRVMSIRIFGYCVCVKHKSFGIAILVFFSFFPSRHFFWTDWQKLFSRFCPIATLSACD